MTIKCKKDCWAAIVPNTAKEPVIESTQIPPQVTAEVEVQKKTPEVKAEKEVTAAEQVNGPSKVTTEIEVNEPVVNPDTVFIRNYTRCRG